MRPVFNDRAVARVLMGTMISYDAAQASTTPEHGVLYYFDALQVQLLK